MALFALSDLHLSLSIPKPMDIFGDNWYNYMDAISKNWISDVGDDDLVIIGGDISWATYLTEAKADFCYLDSLPGKKLILRGNHDYWWESATKLRRYMHDMNFKSIEILNNSAYFYDNFIICGTRLWNLPGTDGYDDKIFSRELIRLELSLKDSLKNADDCATRIAVFHYPPLYPDGRVDADILSLLHTYGIKKCIYGHLHSGGIKNAYIGFSSGIEFMLTSADYLKFTPLVITN